MCLRMTFLSIIGWNRRIFLFRKERITPVVRVTEQNMPKYLVRGYYEQRRRKFYGNIILCSIAKLIVDWIHSVSVPWFRNFFS